MIYHKFQIWNNIVQHYSAPYDVSNSENESFEVLYTRLRWIVQGLSKGTKEEPPSPLYLTRFFFILWREDEMVGQIIVW